MSLRQSLKTALRALSINKMRSGLTMLGIMIGVGAVVAMISIGTGASVSVTSRIQSLGANLLMVTPEFTGGFAGARQAGGMGTTLVYEDAVAIAKEISTVKKVSPEFSSSTQVVYGNQNVNTSIQGVITDYQDVHNFHVAFGEFIRSEDEKMQSRVAVVGQTVVTNLFAGEDPVGKTIKIKNVPFRIIGVMELKGQSGFQNLDDAIFIPLPTAQKRLFGSNNLRMISVQVKNEEEMDLASSQISSLLLSRHKISDPSKADFEIRNQADILSTMSQVTGTLTLLLGGIAAISLLVGGIGIMNIMLVSVTERTREIGLRKAVGAKRKDILTQFLIESLILSLLGGIIGLFLGVVGSFIISKIGEWPTVVTLNSILLSFLFSAAVGIFFGIYPARKASLLSPIDALRFE
ncbi:MAG: ABC transporter permease [Actinobacteria bacterium]|nr:ABC transporter permease [Actinomycetota bacterium]